MPFSVDLGGLEAKPTHHALSRASVVQRHAGQVAGINRNGWPLSSGLGGRFAPDSVADFSRIAHQGERSHQQLAGSSPKPEVAPQLLGPHRSRGNAHALLPAIGDALREVAIHNSGRDQRERYTSTRWSMRTTLTTLASSSMP